MSGHLHGAVLFCVGVVDCQIRWHCSATMTAIIAMWRSRAIALLLAVATTWFITLPCHATAGLAEWSVKTPGTNIVCHSDPYIESHGTCLRPSDEQLNKNPAVTVYVSHIEWWQYFPGRVIGKAAKGFFIFDEVTKSVVFHATEMALRAELTKLPGVKPLTRPLTPQDGWALDWAPILRSNFEQLKKSDSYKAMSPAQKQQMEEQLKQYSLPDIKPTEP